MAEVEVETAVKMRALRSCQMRYVVACRMSLMTIDAWDDDGCLDCRIQDAAAGSVTGGANQILDANGTHIVAEKGHS